MSIYRELGIEPIINASGSVTRLGGAVMPPEVVQAYVDAAQATVPLEHLQALASKRISEATGTDAGIVTTGAAAALTLGTAAILAGLDAGKMERLPHTDGMKNEFIIAREQRSGYDHAVRAAGARLVEVGFNEIIANAGVRRTEVWEYEAAITEKTAGIVYVYSTGSRPNLADLVRMAHVNDIPVLVDAAGELPPCENLKAIPATRADVIAFSGGKSIRGPQSTGILCGRKDLITSAALQMLDMDDHPELWTPPEEFIPVSKLTGMPRHGFCRSMKVAKEQIVSLLKALELFTSGAYLPLVPKYRERLLAIAAALSNHPVSCELIEKGDEESPPSLEIRLDESRLQQTAFDICRGLRGGSPAIYVGHGKLPQKTLVLIPTCIRDEQWTTLTKRLSDALTP
ncbi:MAG: aminotransferase class V-fold PLP-dependent enzyme [Planctomycetota bacterium]|nr:aminotransferase class V-fold PLP-dependent enzyme [Planctomycetota bacterium]MDA1213136.1 aminotransferase class V-fold PLP-dependent enzyme [Planctomycetota bacterium]